MSQTDYNRRRATQAGYRNRKKLYDSAAWQRLRDLILRTRVLCEDCRARGLVVPGSQVDHIVDLAAGGAPLDEANLRLLCAPCHAYKTKSGGRVKGCGVDGVPLDPSHHWRKP